MEKELASTFGLTDHECAIVRMVVQRYTRHEIGSQLGYSRTTLNRRMPAIYRKLGGGDRGEVVALLRERFPDVLKHWELGAVRLYEEDLEPVD